LYISLIHLATPGPDGYTEREYSEKKRAVGVTFHTPKGKGTWNSKTITAIYS
jgi:hypothetical protein